MLTHISIWSDRGWSKIVIEEAIQIFPDTVSSYSGTFFCELCGQFVTLTGPGGLIRHFRHSSHEADKNCPERTFSSGSYYNYSDTNRSLPYRIKIAGKQLDFQIGFIALPNELFKQTQGETLEILAGTSRRKFNINQERFSSEGTAYISVGAEPLTQYHLCYSNTNSVAKFFWAEIVYGIEDIGTLFDKESGKRLPHDADVMLGTPYYLITKNNIRDRYSDVKIIKVMDTRNNWHIYEIQATQLTNEAAKFFLNYHARLTDKPSILIPVWPPCVQRPHILLHNVRDLAFLHIGNSEAKIFPTSYLPHESVDNVNNVSFVSLKCSGRQQLISIGRTNILRYMYLWESVLKQRTPFPSIRVTDVSGNDLEDNEFDTLPKYSSLAVRTLYDGYIEIIENDMTCVHLDLSADKALEIDSLRLGQSVRIYQGLDCIREITFLRHHVRIGPNESDNILFNKLSQYDGFKQIPVPHSLGAIVNKMHDMPKTNKWLRAKIRKQLIPEKAILIIKGYIEKRH